MKKIFFVLVAAIVLLIAGAIGVYFLFNSEVKKQVIPKTQEIIKEATDLNVSFSDFDFSFKNLLKLEPSIVVHDLKVENAITAKEVTASLYLTELLNKKFKIKNFKVENAVINLKQNSKGEFELSGIAAKPKTTKEKEAQKAKAKQQAESFLTEFELKNFSITDSLISLRTLNNPEAIKLNNLNLKLSDFKLDKDENLITKINLDSNLFNSNSSSISLNGQLGPINKEVTSLPINAKQKIKISIASVPPALLDKNMGELVRITDSYISEEANIQGDLMGTSSGSGSIKVENLSVGMTEEKALTLNSSFPISYKLKNKFTPTLTLSTDSSSIDIKPKDNDSGKLIFDADITSNLKSGFLTGSSSGNLTGINVKHVLEALSDIRNVISGDFYLENYNVSFAGSTPKRLFKSAKASADLELKNGSIYILKTITKYKDIADQILKGLNSGVVADKLSGDFQSFKANLKLDNKILFVNDIDVQAAQQIEINGSGKVKNMKWLVFDINLDVPKLEPVPLSIRGTIESPSIYPNVKNITKKQSEQLLNSFIEYGLNSLNKNAPSKSNTAGTSTGTTQQAAPAKQASFGSFLKKTLKDNLKDGLLEEKKPAEPTAPTN